jgi:superfamily I DNA and RNA helicase
LAAAAGALIPIKEKEFSKIDFVQESILDCLHNYKQVQIVGGAGTGKTFIGIKKAVRDCIDGKKVLFICCNSELAKFVDSKISDHYNIDSCTYDELMLKLLGEKYLQVTPNENGNRCCFELLDNVPLNDKYDSIIVDEAQDFDVDMGLSVRSLLKNDAQSTLYVFYDKNQNIFEMDFENAFAIDAPPYVLRYNIRNTGSIYRCAVERTNLGTDTVANNIVGVQPGLHNYSKTSQAVKSLTNIINRLVQKEYVSTKSIVIVSDVAYKDSILADEQKIGAYDISFDSFSSVGENQICFKTAEEFKGLEANIVIYLTHDFENMPASCVDSRKEYVAITRARYYLYILNAKCKAKLGD